MAHPRFRLAKGLRPRSIQRLSHLILRLGAVRREMSTGNGEYDLKDDGRHRIVETEKERRRISNLFRHRQQVSVATNEVTYDRLLQQICQDFDIEYLWYDKICIDQSNKEEKQREIKQMHLIYSNARCTVALVPEVNVDDPKEFDRIDWFADCTEAKATALDQLMKSLWFQRSWTLEEVMMSTRILVVGRNTHFRSLADIKQGDEIKESEFLSDLMLGFTERNLKSANQVLRYAHSRTSTKDHDKIFALANIFHYIIDIDIDYSIGVSTSMKTFYRHLVRKDLSIICFGSKMGVDGNPRYATTMDSYGLPSWTGAAGLHPTGTLADTILDQNCDYTIDNHMRLHIKCRSYTIRLIKYNDLNVFEDDKRGKKAQRNYRTVITSMDDFYGDDERKALDWSEWCMLEATNCTPTHYYKPENHVPFLSPILPLSLTEECDECVILGIVFDSVSPATFNDIVIGYTHNYLSPVASMSTDSSSYKIIGAILLKNFRLDEPRNSPQEYMDNMFDNLECETQEFYIK